MGDLYYVEYSPPSRAVAITARLLGINLNRKKVLLHKREHKTEEFAKINQEMKIPVFVDEDGYTFYESRAIMKYMVKKHGKGNHQLYPNDIKKQYLIDRYFNFDIETFFGRYITLHRPLFAEGKPLDPVNKQRLIEAVGFLDKYLTGKKFITGDDYTLADISLSTTASQIHLSRIDISAFTNVTAWLERCRTTIPYYQEENEQNLNAFKEFIDFKFSQLNKD